MRQQIKTASLTIVVVVVMVAVVVVLVIYCLAVCNCGAHESLKVFKCGYFYCRSKVPGESPGSERAHKVVDEDQCDQCATSKEVQCSQSARNKDELELIASIKQLAQYGEN